MQQGQTLVNKNGDERKILGVCGEVYFLSYVNDFSKVTVYGFTAKMIEESGWFPLEEPWRPTLSEPYWFVDVDGGFMQTYWGIDDMNEHDYRYSIGNVHQNPRKAELYRQKLIERMGSKE